LLEFGILNQGNCQNSLIDSLSSNLENTHKSIAEKASSLKIQAQTYLNNNEFLRALGADKEALLLYSILEKEVDRGEILLHIGNIYQKINDYDNAIKNYLEALSLFEKNEESLLIPQTKKAIGELYVQLDQCHLAFNYLFDVQSIYTNDSITYQNEFSDLFHSIGIAYGNCGNLDSSLYYFNTSMNLLALNDSSLVLGGMLNNIGAIYSKKGENKKAINYYRQSLQLFQKLNNTNGIAVSKSNIAYVFKKQKKFSESISLYNEALMLFEESNSLLYLRDNYYNLSEVYKEIKDYKNALYYNNLYISLDDSITNSEILGKIASLQTQFEIRKKDQELLLLEQEKQIIEKDRTLKQTQQYILIGGLIILILITFLIYRNMKISLRHNQLKQKILKQEKDELTQDLDYKNKELEEFALKIIQKNELLIKLKSDIKQIDSSLPENKEKLKELSSSINSSLYIEKDRKEFELQLNKTYQSFFLKLDKQFPDLSKNERRLCSLLVLDLSSKDIATILNISPESVKKNRYRLRKKLNLETDENLTHFLQNS
ncbi:MAG: tetratricopeptide repeat protein, partial [Flavobacteriales bacterium]|nr:tetratricopeptide repeat protein [Flavobacteriales bacterium]